MADTLLSNWRLTIVFAFLGVILTGVPMWWKTTEVYRPDLPVEEVRSFVEHTEVTLPLHLEIVVITEEKGHTYEHLRQELSAILKVDRSPFAISLFGNQGISNVKSFLAENNANILDDLLLKVPGSDISMGKYRAFILVDKRFTDTTATLGKYRHLWLKVPSLTEATGKNIAKIISSLLKTCFANSVELNPSKKEELEMIQLKKASSYHLSFVLCNAYPEKISGWDFENTHQRILSKFTEKISAVADFRIDSQVVHFTELEKQPLFDSKDQFYYFTKETLPYFVQSNSWKLDFVADTKPVIHFVLYVPNKSNSPLYIKNSDGRQSETNAFVVPQWGGVVIHNPNLTHSGASVVLGVDDLVTPTELFVSQFRELVGIPLSTEKAQLITQYLKKAGISASVELLDDPNSGITDWEMDAIILHRLKFAHHSAAETLVKFIELVETLTNIPVQDRLVGYITTTIENLRKSLECAKQGDYACAYAMAQNASDTASTAFFDSEMIGLLYFPDEHKSAIYLPLFLPLTFPLFGTVRREYRRWKEKKKNPKKTTTPPRYLPPPADSSDTD